MNGDLSVDTGRPPVLLRLFGREIGDLFRVSVQRLGARAGLVHGVEVFQAGLVDRGCACDGDAGSVAGG